RDYIERNLPGVHLIEPEGTYLIWLDFRDLRLPEEKLEHLITKEAKLWLDSGKIFGKTGAGFQRINVAAPRKTVEECLERIRRIL
ncbi:MAG: aminotransferase, partial [Clostridiales bacterium]|nr:aminotransferase [Clostridiales bacterium]